MQSNPVVQTDLGIIQGVEETVLGNAVQKFIGIPYGIAPVGELRFKKPLPINKWNGVKVCKDFSTAPWQTLARKVGEFNSWEEMWNPKKECAEDCLYLNIWKVKSTSIDDTADNKRSVMVWIFGGGFMAGSTCLGIYDGSILASQSSAIIVSISYRIGCLGFLYLNEDAPGNQGLWDQLLALKWIKSNIESFGGDSNNITLFGESAGAVSICCHLLSPHSQPYFDKAIMQSGTALATWSIMSKEEMKRRGEQLCKLLSVDLNSCAEDRMKHLREIDPQTLIDQQWLTTEGSLQFPFTPIVDEDFLPDWPETLLKTGKFKKCPILIGNTENEGSLFLLYNDKLMNHVTGRETQRICDAKEFEELIKLTFTHYPHYPHETPQHIVKQIVEYYNNNQKQSRTLEENLVIGGHALGHLHFTHDTVEIVRLFSEHNNSVYLYHFNCRMQNDPLPLWTEVKHADEIPVVFGCPLKMETYSQQDKKLSRMMINWWTSFAACGKPTTTELTQEWLPFDNEQELCLHIGPDIEMKKYHLTDIHEFWLNIHEANKKNG